MLKSLKLLLLYSPWGKAKICDVSKRQNLEDRVTLIFNAAYCLLLTAWCSILLNAYYSLLISFKVARSSRFWRFNMSQILPSPRGDYNNYIRRNYQDQIQITSRSKSSFFCCFFCCFFKIWSLNPPPLLRVSLYRPFYVNKEFDWIKKQ